MNTLHIHFLLLLFSIIFIDRGARIYLINMIREQKNISQQSTDKENQSDQDILFQYFLKCDCCSWSASFYEVSGNIHLDIMTLRCPTCFKKEVRWRKVPF